MVLLINSWAATGRGPVACALVGAVHADVASLTEAFVTVGIAVRHCLDLLSAQSTDRAVVIVVFLNWRAGVFDVAASSGVAVHLPVVNGELNLVGKGDGLQANVGTVAHWGLRTAHLVLS
jgi:hypothetical protein